VIPLANQIDVLFRIGKEKEAGEAFARLREISGSIDDLTLAPFARLSEIASALDFPADWRVARQISPDVGVRPALDSIGPLRYTPPSAPDWSLPDASGDLITLKQFEGRPVVVIFYLGHGCLHCVEQLSAFAPKTKEFNEAGISLVAISTDDVLNLRKSIDGFGGQDGTQTTIDQNLQILLNNSNDTGGFPFPLVSDAGLRVFKSYRAFDDFENQPLHGTFLIDGDGLVRWQDISYEPFNNPDFLLKEARRLLELPVKSGTSLVSGD
jgi:peroxiredoxin